MDLSTYLFTHSSNYSLHLFLHFTYFFSFFTIFISFFSKLLDVEEITHKAGNFKKFFVFAKMLSAALTEENDSVLYVDLLTYSDLELLKARKSGGAGTGAGVGVGQIPSQAMLSNKRYVILTYSGKCRAILLSCLVLSCLFLFLYFSTHSSPLVTSPPHLSPSFISHSSPLISPPLPTSHL